MSRYQLRSRDTAQHITSERNRRSSDPETEADPNHESSEGVSRPMAESHDEKAKESDSPGQARREDSIEAPVE